MDIICDRNILRGETLLFDKIDCLYVNIFAIETLVTTARNMTDGTIHANVIYHDMTESSTHCMFRTKILRDVCSYIGI